MKLLVDTDVFCKLAVCGLLPKAVDLLGADLTECGRLPALQYMLKKGRLRTFYGPDNCDAMIPIAIKMPIVWLGSGDRRQYFAHDEAERPNMMGEPEWYRDL